ncbi:unnamed protein product [Peniophora sp. CBMAI 1063]|nr:unnamed protein product [Peniophora sp. CBMAI 1063]
MGASISAIGNIFADEEVMVNMLGLDSTGKTTILNRFKGRSDIVTVPTIGFNMEIVPHQRLNFCIRDFGGVEKIRPLWHCYFGSTKALIFVVDCGDHERIEEARKELREHVLVYENLEGVPVLVYANKQDLPKAMAKDEVIDRLGMRELKGHRWHVQPACAATALLNRIIGRENVPAEPTFLYHRKLVRYIDIPFVVYDFGGRGRLRSVWHSFFTSTAQGIILVVDSSDRERMTEGKDMLHDNLLDVRRREIGNIKRCPLLVFANKQDYLPKALSSDEVVEKLGLRDIQGMCWHVQPCSAITGDGLSEGLEWLARNRAGIPQL